MDSLEKKLTSLLRRHFEECDVELERSTKDRIGGLLIWDGFIGLEQLKRQRKVWQILRKELSAEDQLRISAVLTLTPDEMAAAREG